jgi:hypothetical protein
MEDPDRWDDHLEHRDVELRDRAIRMESYQEDRRDVVLVSTESGERVRLNLQGVDEANWYGRVEPPHARERQLLWPRSTWVEPAPEDEAKLLEAMERRGLV